MSPEAPKTNTTAEEAAATFHAAQSEIYKFTANDEFALACREAGIDPASDMHTAEYWNIFAVAADRHVQEKRAQEGNSMQLSAFELMALAPDYLFRQEELDNKAYRDPQSRRIAKETVSYYNSLLRSFAHSSPEVPVSVVLQGLNVMADAAIENTHLRQSASNQLLQTVRGAQHELAFGQILAHSGRQFQAAEMDQDLKGIDYLVEGFGGATLYVDVKASLSEIESRDKMNSAFACKPDGNIVMYSLTRDNEFKDRFFTSEDIAESKAAAVNAFLAQAQQDIASGG